jgi:hypothetical protein
LFAVGLGGRGLNRFPHCYAIPGSLETRGQIMSELARLYREGFRGDRPAQDAKALASILLGMRQARSEDEMLQELLETHAASGTGCAGSISMPNRRLPFPHRRPSR